MDIELKRRLLERKFSSLEYMEEMAKWHQKAIDSLLAALRQFYQHPPQHEDWHNWHQSDWPETWEERVLSNIRGTHRGIEDGIKKAKFGDFSYIESVAAELHSIFRNLDSVGWGWWKHIHHSYEDDFRETLGAARDIASNIMRQLARAWKTEESILDEEIVGPINENDLLAYLKPGETP